MRKKKSFLSLYKKTKQKQKRQREHTLTPNRLVKRACLIKTPIRFTFVTKRPITFSPTRSFKRKRNFGTPLSFRYTFGANLVLSSEKRKITNFDRNNILQKLQTVHLPRLLANFFSQIPHSKSRDLEVEGSSSRDVHELVLSESIICK